MSLYAFDDVNDAFAAARAFLLPFDPGRWLRLVVVVLFLGGSGFNLPMGGFDIPAGDTGGPPPGESPEITTAVLVAVALVLGVILLLGLAYLFVGSVMEFVLIASLRDETVTLRRYWRRNLGRGTRLFGFRVGLGVLGLLIFGGMVALLLVPFLGGGLGIVAAVVLFVVMLPVVFLVGLVFAVVNLFTTAFVVPVMLHEKRGVIDGWRRFWPTLRGNLKEYAAYAVIAWLISAGLSIAAGFVLLIAGLILLVPALILGLIGFVILMILPPVGIAVLVLTGVLYVIGMVLAYALVQVAVQTYLRYYGLLVLGDTNDALDLVPDRRAAIRAEDA